VLSAGFRVQFTTGITAWFHLTNSICVALIDRTWQVKNSIIWRMRATVNKMAFAQSLESLEIDGLTILASKNSQHPSKLMASEIPSMLKAWRTTLMPTLCPKQVLLERKESEGDSPHNKKVLVKVEPAVVRPRKIKTTVLCQSESWALSDYFRQQIKAFCVNFWGFTGSASCTSQLWMQSHGIMLWSNSPLACRSQLPCATWFAGEETACAAWAWKVDDGMVAGKSPCTNVRACVSRFWHKLAA